MPQCNACNNLHDAICDEWSYKLAVVSTLCSILNAIENSSKILTSVILPQVVKEADDIQNDYTSFATVGLVNNSKKLNYLRIVNTSDSGLQFSFDAGNTVAFTVLSGTTYNENLNITLSSTTSLRMRRVSGETASLGNVIIEGRYNA